MSNIVLNHITADLDDALLVRLHKLAERAGTEPDDVIIAFLEARSELHGDSDRAIALIETLIDCINDGADDERLHAIVREAREHFTPPSTEHVTIDAWRDEVEARLAAYERAADAVDVPTVRDVEAFVEDVDNAFAQTHAARDVWGDKPVTLDSVREDLAKLATLTGRPVDLVEHDAKHFVTDAEALAFAESVKHGHACIDLAAERMKRATSIMLRGGESTGFVLPPSRETYEPDADAVARVKEGVTRYHLDTLARLDVESRAEIVDDVTHDEPDPFDGLALPKKTPPALRPLAVLSLTTAALLVASGIDARDAERARPRDVDPGRARTPGTPQRPTPESKTRPEPTSSESQDPSKLGNSPLTPHAFFSREQRRRRAQLERAAAKRAKKTGGAR